MAPETWTPATGEESRFDQVEISHIQAEAAKEAATVGSFQSNFRRMIDYAISNGDIHASAASKRIETVEKATHGNEDIRLDTVEQGVLGYNHIGAGRSGMKLSRNTFAQIDSVEDKDDINQTVAHEAAHGKQVALKGELVIDGEVIDHELLYEGHAEIHGNEAVAMSMHEHREGQPEDLYKEGQNIAVDIVRKAGRAALERALTQDGDLSRLQQEYEGALAA